MLAVIVIVIVTVGSAACSPLRALASSRPRRHQTPTLAHPRRSVDELAAAGPVVHSDFLENHALARPVERSPDPAKVVELVGAAALGNDGMKGLAMQNHVPLPTKQEVLQAIPKECFKRNTLKSMAFALGSTAATAACGLVGLKMAQTLPILAATLPGGLGLASSALLWMTYGTYVSLYNAIYHPALTTHHPRRGPLSPTSRNHGHGGDGVLGGGS